MAVDTSLHLKLAATQTAALDLGTLSFTALIEKSLTLASGTGANQADRMFSDQRTLAASASESLDLAGSLTDVAGATITFARVKAVFVEAVAANTNDVQVTRPASNGLPLFMAASDGIAVRPGGMFAWVAPDATGVAVTAGTGDLLAFTNSAGTTGVTYNVIIVGASA